MWKSAKNTYKFEGGIRGFYQGFVPGSIFLAALYHADLYYLCTGKELYNVRKEIKELKVKYNK
jgi:hypothetical protein